MTKTNKVLIGILLISTLLIGIGYSAIENITLDIGGTATANPSTKVLVNGEDFNKMLKGSTSTTTSDTTITKIVFDYWENGYSDNGTQVYSDEDWERGIAIDRDGIGGIRLFKSEDEKKAYILSEAPIYGNEDCKLMFSNFEAVIELVFNNFDTSNVTKMNYMFQYCSSLIKLNLSNFNTEKVYAIEYMFLECSQLTELDLSSFKISKVTNMERVFAQCASLKELDLSGFDTSKVTNIKRMFWNCKALTELDLSSFNTSNVQNMEWMFVYCENLTKLNLSSFNTSKVTTMNHMFSNCKSLTKIDLSNFNTSNVQNMGNMFGYCSALTELDISSFDTSKVTNMGRMFDHCTLLKELDISSFDTSSTTSMIRMFANNPSLTTIYVSNKWTIEKVNHSGISSEDQPFIAAGNIVEGAGTRWNSACVDISYARVDGGPNSQTPGYLTLKSST